MFRCRLSVCPSIRPSIHLPDSSFPPGEQIQSWLQGFPGELAALTLLHGLPAWLASRVPWTWVPVSWRCWMGELGIRRAESRRTAVSTEMPLPTQDEGNSAQLGATLLWTWQLQDWPGSWCPTLSLACIVT